ncbi:hypothetical protein Glove_645g35 [Diversispora epigaea]|uniref:Uncharacterized protein n=1 Tax=Diversispora epigaea TaxID=1348612 RepID=A0A397G7N4_9GLOM|nr:hypothetical protein Glove_645g35 [Diversispora epigaea]
MCKTLVQLLSLTIPSDTDELTSDESIEDNDNLDCNNDHVSKKDPPKIDKVAFRKTHDAIPDTTKLKLSTEKIVEDILFNFCKNMDYEHHAHSYIVDFDDENIKALFTDSEWKELTKDRIGVPIISHDIIKELARYEKGTLEDLRTVTMKSFLEEEKYDIRKHYTTIKNGFNWPFELLIDAPSSSSANRKNRNRKANTRKRKLVGRKIDGIIYTTDELLEFGAIEGARSFKGVSDNKYLNEEFKMPKTLRDMYSDLIRAVNYDDQRASKLQVIGILHLGLWIQFVRLWRAGGSICIFRKDPQSFNIHSKFSKKGLRSFLKFLARIYQYKIIIKNNLQVLDILNDDDNDNDNDDELKELNEQCSTPPPTSIQFFADCESTPKKKRTNSKEKNPRQKKIKSNHL